MTFGEKLNALLSLTTTKNSELARAIHIDQSQISRMKTGAREQPKKAELIRLMADYFSKCCFEEEHLIILAQLTGDFHINADIGDHQLSTILFKWLSEREDIKPKAKAKRLLYNINQYSPDNPKRNSVPAKNHFQSNNDFAIYYGKEGKRQATRDMVQLLLSTKTRCQILVVSDEHQDWIYEDVTFTRELSQLICSCTQAGCQFTHIFAPTADIDGALCSIQRWLPAYMTGAICQYYYPWLRDKLFRHTLCVIPGICTLYSESIGDASDIHMTTLTTVPEVVDIYEQKFADYLTLCKPMTEVYTIETTDKLFKFASSLREEYSDGLYKFASLSTHMLPPEIMERICKQENTTISEKVYKNHLLNIKSRERTLKTCRLEDMICLASLEEIKNGVVPIPNASVFKKRYYYTPDEYKTHLQSITDELEFNKNYHVTITDAEAINSLIMYVKGNEHAMLVKKSDNFTMFNIIDPQLVSAFCDYLKSVAERERQKCSRQNTIKRLKKYISLL